MPTNLEFLLPGGAPELVRREAKRLHRAATSDSLAAALPVLRRLLAAGAITETTLPGLFRRRDTVQRKHVLRTLAFEAGSPSWEAYRPTLDHTDVRQLEAFAVVGTGYAKLNLWFSNEPDAARFASQHGGHSVRVGTQAVVLHDPERRRAGERRGTA
jgi:hypothetical protein